MLRFLKIAVLAGVPFGLLMAVVLAPVSNSGVSLKIALATGGAFGLLMAGFAAWQRSRFTQEDPCGEGERLVKQGPANHFLGWEAVGGWLSLTDQRLLFRSHRFNVQRHELPIPLAEVKRVEACWTAWIIPNGLRVVTARGTERFVVEGRQSWVTALNQARRHLA